METCIKNIQLESGSRWDAVLGIVNNDQRKYEDVIEWMQEALKRMSALYEYSSALTKIDVLEYLSSDKYKVGLNDTQAIVRRHLSDSLRTWKLKC